MILISGSQFYNDMESLEKVAKSLKGEVLLSGKRGPCMFFKKYCQDNNIVHYIETADWKGPNDFSSGKFRNQKMVNILLRQEVKSAILFQAKEPNGKLDSDIKHLQSQLEQSNIKPDVYIDGQIVQKSIFEPATKRDLGDEIDTDRII